jgi:hypothetical protein
VFIVWLFAGAPVPPGEPLFVPAVAAAVPCVVVAVRIGRERKRTGIERDARPSPRYVALMLAGSTAFLATAVAGAVVRQSDPAIGLGNAEVVDGRYYISPRGNDPLIEVDRATYDKARRYLDLSVLGVIGFLALAAARTIEIAQPAGPVRPPRGPSPLWPEDFR